MTETKHEDPNRVYKLSEEQKNIVRFTLGYSEPRNQDERELLKEIKEIEARGHMVIIPLIGDE